MEFYHGREVGAQIQSSLTQVAAAGACQTGYTPASFTDTGIFPARDFWKRSYFERLILAKYVKSPNHCLLLDFSLELHVCILCGRYWPLLMQIPLNISRGPFSLLSVSHKHPLGTCLPIHIHKTLELPPGRKAPSFLPQGFLGLWHHMEVRNKVFSENW